MKALQTASAPTRIRTWGLLLRRQAHLGTPLRKCLQLPRKEVRESERPAGTWAARMFLLSSSAPIALICLAYLLVWALCAAAGQADERLERERATQPNERTER